MDIVILRGDGIGPEIAEATVAIVKAVDAKHALNLNLIEAPIGFAALQQHGHVLPDPVFDTMMAADGLIVGPLDTYAYPPAAEGGINASARLRTGLDLWANIRPAKTRAGIPAVASDMDLMIVRENTEGFYADRNMVGGMPSEFMPVEGVGLSLRKITAEASRRIAEAAFRQAAHRKGHVTAVHKANVMKVTDGLFLQHVRRVAQDHPEITYEEMIVDAAAAWLVRKPAGFDVIVTTNMFGDILSDEASELAGSLGLAPSINYGTRHVMAQAQHGSAPDIAGQGIANPTSLILSAAMMLAWLGDRHGRGDLVKAATEIETIMDRCLADQANHTPDLGGSATTANVADAVLSQLR